MEGGQTILDNTLPYFERITAMKKGKQLIVTISGTKQIQHLMDLMEGRKQKSDEKWGELLGVPPEKIQTLKQKMKKGIYTVGGRNCGKSSRSR